MMRLVIYKWGPEMCTKCQSTPKIIIAQQNV